MVTYHQVRDALERAVHEYGPDASALEGAVAELVLLEYREVAYADVYDKLRAAMWPPPRCACDLARVAWRALPSYVP